MKHYVITPFYPYAKTPLTDEGLFIPGNEVLVKGLEHLKCYLLPSLVNSTTHDFTLLLGIRFLAGDTGASDIQGAIRVLRLHERCHVLGTGWQGA